LTNRGRTMLADLVDDAKRALKPWVTPAAKGGHS
jgi:hypothetical protein